MSNKCERHLKNTKRLEKPKTQKPKKKVITETDKNRTKTRRRCRNSIRIKK